MRRSQRMRNCFIKTIKTCFPIVDIHLISNGIEIVEILDEFDTPMRAKLGSLRYLSINLKCILSETDNYDFTTDRFGTNPVQYKYAFCSPVSSKKCCRQSFQNWIVCSKNESIEFSEFKFIT